MSALEDFLIQELKPKCDAFWNANAHKYDTAHKDGCGQYIEALIPHLRSLGYSKVGYLKKTGSGTQYNGHSIDGFLYREGDPTLYRHVDVIAGAEAPGASAGFGIDIPRYTDSDWYPVATSTPPSTGMVPWVPYDENGFQELKRQLAYDYARRPQGPDYDVSVWAARTFHNSYMGPNKVPMGFTAGLEKARAEWCAALGVPVVPVPPSWNIGDPV